jgi:drug/metabolite transporter (DMT)-like permease
MKHLKEHQTGIMAVVTAAILWSSGGLFVKLITLTPMQISFFRCAIAALTFALIFRRQVLQYNLLTFINSFFYAGVMQYSFNPPLLFMY